MHTNILGQSKQTPTRIHTHAHSTHTYIHTSTHRYPEIEYQLIYPAVVLWELAPGVGGLGLCSLSANSVFPLSLSLSLSSLPLPSPLSPLFACLLDLQMKLVGTVIFLFTFVLLCEIMFIHVTTAQLS